MVRLKSRYLLLEILYPEPSTWPAAPKPAQQAQSSHLRIHAPTSNALTPGHLARLIREEVGELYGDWGVGRLGGSGGGGVSVKYLSPATSTAIIRCPRASYRLVWAALTYLGRVPGPGPGPGNAKGGGRGGSADTRECVFRVVRVSGTMRKAEEEAIRRARREIVRVQGVEEEGVFGVGGVVGRLEDEEDVGMEDSEDD